jgi:hypothetical protein
VKKQIRNSNIEIVSVRVNPVLIVIPALVGELAEPKPVSSCRNQPENLDGRLLRGVYPEPDEGLRGPAFAGMTFDLYLSIPNSTQ